MGVFHCSLLQVGGTAHIVVRSKDETGSFTAEKLPDRLDLFGRGLLFGEQVIQAEDHQCVGVAEDALVQRQSLAGLIDPLKDRDRRSGARPTTSWNLTMDRWNSSSVPAIPCRNIFCENSAVS